MVGCDSIPNNCVSVPGGTGNYVDYANTFGFTSGAFSAVTWVNSTDTSSSSTVVLGKHHATIVAGWMLRVNQDSAGYGAPGKASVEEVDHARLDREPGERVEYLNGDQRPP